MRIANGWRPSCGMASPIGWYWNSRLRTWPEKWAWESSGSSRSPDTHWDSVSAVGDAVSGTTRMSRWYYTLDNRQRLGPVTSEQLRQLAASGMIRPECMV